MKRIDVGEVNGHVFINNSSIGMEWPGVAGAEMDPSLSYKGHFNQLTKFKKQHPDVKTLISILTEPKNAIVKQYRKIFNMEHSDLEFTPGALELIAERALKRDTGARALRAVCEEIMLELMYKLPDQAHGGKYVVNEDVVEGRQSLFEIKPPERRKESA